MDLMKAFLVLGDLTDENQSLADKVAYKQRIVFATMRASIPEWQPPSDWDSLTDEVKLERLEKIQAL